MDRPNSQNSLGKEKKDDLHGATTSNITSSRPVSASHNMNDLKMFDFNSADEIRSKRDHNTRQTKHTAPKFMPPAREAPLFIRQAMKAMLSGNKPHSGDEMKPQTTKADKNSKNDTSGNVFKIVNGAEDATFSNNVRRKRRGRPPNAGPSKRVKKTSVTNMFVGKLSNVVHYASASESDDSLY